MEERKIIIEKAARAGAKALLKSIPEAIEILVKTGENDVVTSADLASEAAIIEVIRANYPDDLIVSEESDEITREQLKPDRVGNFTGWVIDPIDGTNSFRYRMNYSGISIGYIVNGQSVLGAVLDPFRDELLIGEKDKGATINGLTLKVATTNEFNKATRVCFTNSYDNAATRANFERHLKLPTVPWTEVVGSAVLVMREIASGRLDIYHHNGLKPWDNAAGFLIVSEAGGKIVGLAGQPVDWTTSEVVMGNATLVDEFVRLTN